MFKSSYDVSGSTIKNPTEITQKTSSTNANYSWEVLGQGSYNLVWKSNFASPLNLVPGDSYEGPWVLKYAIVDDEPISNAMNEKSRSVRLWNEINHTLPKAGLYQEGWVAPYLEDSRPANDDEITQKSIEIYCDTRRIILDAATKGNFLTHLETGDVSLVDMDLALKRSTSLASLNFAEILEDQFALYWTNSVLQKSMPKTINITRNLLFLEDNLSMDFIDELCQEKQITVKNVQSLTWLRLNKRPLTPALFRKIASLNESGQRVSDKILGALSTLDAVKSNPKSSYRALTSKSSPSFFPAESLETMEPIIKNEYSPS